MKLITIGGNGYLGSEIMHQAAELGHDSLGTYHSRPSQGLIQFDLENRSTWEQLTRHRADVVIWAAYTDNNAPSVSKLFAEWLTEISPAKVVYLSSDVVLCPRTLTADSRLGAYARQKQTDSKLVLARPNGLVSITGPIYGRNSAGALDKRTRKLLETDTERHEYWNDVFKTWVPVDGLAQTILANLNASGEHCVGPVERTSYFDFYQMQAKAHDVPAGSLHPSNITDQELETLALCRDTSYSSRANRLWYESY